MTNLITHPHPEAVAAIASELAKLDNTSAQVVAAEALTMIRAARLLRQWQREQSGGVPIDTWVARAAATDRAFVRLQRRIILWLVGAKLFTCYCAVMIVSWPS